MQNVGSEKRTSGRKKRKKAQGGLLKKLDERGAETDPTPSKSRIKSNKRIVPRISVVFLGEKALFLIDTGCELNLIKQKFVDSNCWVNRSIIYDLLGIGSGMTPTLEEITVLNKRIE